MTTRVLECHRATEQPFDDPWHFAGALPTSRTMKSRGERPGGPESHTPFPPRSSSVAFGREGAAWQYYFHE
jgi:hypothetical protein